MADDAPAVPIRSPMQIATPLPLTMMLDRLAVGLLVEKRSDDEAFVFECNGERIVGENEFASAVLRNLNQYPTRLAIRRTVGELLCTHSHVGWTNISWDSVKQQQWHGNEVWIHMNVVVERADARRQGEESDTDVLITDTEIDEDDYPDEEGIFTDSEDDEEIVFETDEEEQPQQAGGGEIAAARTITIPPQVWQQLGVALPAPPIIERTFIADLPINHYEARRRRRRRQPPPPPPPEECSICMGPLTGNALTLKHMRRGETLDTQRVEAPCGHSEHQVCLGCLRRHATNWSHHSIGPMNHGGVLCPHEGCRAQYLVVDFARVLEQGDQTKLEEMQRRFSRSGAAVCLGCGDTMHFNPERLRDAQAGSVAQRCTRCPRIQCYHCMRAIHSARFAIATNVGMHPCRCQENMVPEPGHFNRWFVAPPSSVGPLARNRELTVEDCVRQLTELCQSEEVHVPCAHCGTRMHRATACMELTHCGIKRCNVCGISGLEHESVLFDHWDGHGVRGCPRWATDPFWQHVIPQNVVRCEEGVCHTATKDCTDPAHEEYRTAVREVRRMRMLHTALRTLPAGKRNRVIAGLQGKAAEVLLRVRLAASHGGLI